MLNLQPFTIDQLITLQRIPVRTPFHLSPDGKYLAITVESGKRDFPSSTNNKRNSIPHNLAASKIKIIDTTTGSVTTPFGNIKSMSPRWSEDGKLLAAYLLNGDRVSLGIWHRDNGQIQIFANTEINTIFGGYEVFGCAASQWMPNNQAVVLQVKTKNSAADSQQTSNVSVFSFDPHTENSEQQQAESSLSAFLSGDLVIFDINSAEKKLLAQNWAFRSWRVSPNGKNVAVLKATNRKFDNTHKYTLYDLVVLPLDASLAITVASNIPQTYGISFSWSPDSQYIAYTTQKILTLTVDEQTDEGELFVVSAEGATPPSKLSNTETPNLGQNYETPRWSQDGREIYCLTSSGVWITATNESSCRSLTVNADIEVVYWIQRPLFNLFTLWENNKIPLVFRNPKTLNSGLAFLDVETGENTILFEDAKNFADDVLSAEIGNDGNFYFAWEAANTPAEIWCVANSGRETKQLFALNPNLSEIAFGKSQLISWRGSDGNECLGALMLPQNYVEGQKLPLIVNVYGGVNNSSFLNNFDFGWSGHDHPQLFATRGYAYLCPDMSMSNRDPMRQLPGLVLPAINLLVDLGIVDSQRVGVIGQSYGGYNVLALLTQTYRFQAAVASAGIYNLTSFYGILTNHGKSRWINWAEKGQGQMGGSLWEKRDAYIENSPLFYLDRVETPILLVSGTGEPGEVAQASEVFSGFRRLGKRVEMRLYDREGHYSGGWSQKSLRDVGERVVSWFDSYLGSGA
ncbi:MAG: prolyl oligopeptidase family serine peptidase [Microcoleaceae cyanobacterium]